jgi:hypothetical protein
MDPNATLRAIADATDTHERAELCAGLSAWIARGGFAPDWTQPGAHTGAAIFRAWSNAR